MSCRPAMLRGCKAGLFIHPVFLSLHFCSSTAYVLMFEISVLLLSELHFDIVIAVYWKITAYPSFCSQNADSKFFQFPSLY